jgi:lycopene beta-cyclase
MLHNHYDYIIAGTGCAGLSLAMHMMQQPSLQQKKILLVDKAEKIHNDRTWCFWEKGNGFFENIVYRQWEELQFSSNTFSGTLSIAPYRYKMIRGLDFYRCCLEALKKNPSITFCQGNVTQLFSNEKTGIIVDGKEITADYVFSSILPAKPQLQKKDVWLLQHFKGWLIETEKPAFDEKKATLMDFRISQKKGTAFCYVLPSSSSEALVEYTLFTPSLLQPNEYEAELKTYISDYLKIDNYTIRETEFGVIPMTNHRFTRQHNHIINIGTAGGQTKGSSGYTFYFIQQHCQQLVESLVNRGHPFVAATPRRFHFYDSVLLQVLDRDYLPGEDIFATMFRKNKPQDVLAFLNNASSLATELKIISTLPTFPFLKAAMRQIM